MKKNMNSINTIIIGASILLSSSTSLYGASNAYKLQSISDSTRSIDFIYSELTGTSYTPNSAKNPFGPANLTPAIDALTANMKECGLSVKKEQFQEGISVKCSVDEKALSEKCDVLIATELKGFQGLLVKTIATVLGNNFENRLVDLTKKRLKVKVEAQMIQTTEKELLTLVDISGIKVFKGKEPLVPQAESIGEEPIKKIKPR